MKLDLDDSRLNCSVATLFKVKSVSETSIDYYLSPYINQ